MNSSRKNPNYSINIVNKIKPFNQVELIEHLNYMYLNEHQFKIYTSWFKGIKDRGFKSDFSAKKD